MTLQGTGAIGMDPDSITRYITASFPGVEVAKASGDLFFFAGPDRRKPFAPLVTGDRYDTASNLARPDVFRLNIGVGRAAYEALFGAAGPAVSGHDFAALARLRGSVADG